MVTIEGQRHLGDRFPMSPRRRTGEQASVLVDGPQTPVPDQLNARTRILRQLAQHGLARRVSSQERRVAGVVRAEPFPDPTLDREHRGVRRSGEHGYP